MSVLNEVLSGLADLLYPPECHGCGQRTSSRFVCSRCEETFNEAGSVPLTADLPAGVLPLVATWMFREREPIQRVMHQVKYANRPWIGIEMGRILGEKLRAQPTLSPTLIVPIPLHKMRYAQRGYNQSEWIAQGVASSLAGSGDVTLATDVLVRARFTKSQTALSREERITNVGKAFRVGGRGLGGEHVILVDDTVTTGATLMTAAEALIEAGAAAVQPAAVAAAPLRMRVEHATGFPVIPA
jgi:ComF family protein